MLLTDYRTLGRSGLVVSHLAQGTMTFATPQWGTAEDVSLDVFDAYLQAGGNFIDSADVYSAGRSEEMLGRFIAQRVPRERLVIATKSGFAAEPGVHAGGNGRTHVRSALEGSLRRLQTDYVDLLWVHVWDSLTPAEELLETMSNLIREGKARYWGISNSPAWYVAKVATLAAGSGKPGPIALQYAYSLVHREIEHEFFPLASDFGMAIQPWSPLAFGLLTGKYGLAGDEAKDVHDNGRGRSPVGARAGRPEAERRLAGANPFGNSLFTDRNRAIVDVVERVANESGESAARVALAWVIQRPGVCSPLLGASRPAQIQENVAALDICLASAHLAELDKVSMPVLNTLYSLFTPEVRRSAVFGGASVRPWSRAATC